MTENPTGPLAAFLARKPSGPATMGSGNTAEAVAVARDLREAVTHAAVNAPRSVQRHLGPSEIGDPCHRQVVGKLAHVPATNHVSDPWPSVVGTAGHAWLAETLSAARPDQWWTERRVVPIDGHSGTADLYDTVRRAVIDHKLLGRTTHPKVRAGDIPRGYFIQLLLYALGYIRAGYPVDRVMLAAWSRGGRLTDLYVWDHVLTAEDWALLEYVIFTELPYRKQWAESITSGTATLLDVPIGTDKPSCYFCLAGDTEVTTASGVRRIDTLAGTDVTLRAPDGSWVTAPVRQFGVQATRPVTLRRGRQVRTVRATREHVWVLADGTRTTTHALESGDKLASPPNRCAVLNLDPEWAARGFVYGDGAKPQGNRPGTVKVYSAGNKASMLPLLTATTGRTPAEHPDGWHYYGCPRDWKALPDITGDRDALLSWASGYFAADGTVSKASPTLSGADKASVQAFRDVLDIHGVRVGAIHRNTRTRQLNGREYTSDLYSVSFNVRDVPENFWLLPHHLATVEHKLSKPARNRAWRVESVGAPGAPEPVYCATVPRYEAFTLSESLVTGNCPFYRPEAVRNADTAGCPGLPGHQ